VVYSLEFRNLMERTIQLRMDNYSITTYINDECDEENASKINNYNDKRMDK
jgi:hypothetical protein